METAWNGHYKNLSWYEQTIPELVQCVGDCSIGTTGTANRPKPGGEGTPKTVDDKVRAHLEKILKIGK